MTEDQQLNRILEGCRKEQLTAQHELYKLFYSYGMSICKRYVFRESEALSIMNDSFLKVYRSIRKYDPSLPFKPWFRTILINTAINQIKKDKKFKSELMMETPQDASVSEMIISKLGYDDIMKSVQTLSAMYRTVFNLYVIDGYRHEEIANILGISVNTSKSNLSRAKANLRKLLSENLEIKNARQSIG